VIVWVVSVGDTERNFARRRDALAWLVRLTHDTRPNPRVHRETAFRYRYYGPGDDLRFVAVAAIDKLMFPPRRFYVPKLRKRRREESEVLAASDPHVPDPGTPSTRA
jgi:hypothetical protein